MTFFSKRKRKNDDPPRFPAWIIVLMAIGLVIYFGYGMRNSRLSKAEKANGSTAFD